MVTWEELCGLIRAHMEALHQRRLEPPKKVQFSRARRLATGCFLLGPPVHLILHRPEERLVVYGTLVPGGKFHHLLSDLQALWEPCYIRGRLGTYRGYPFFKWNPAGEAHPAWLVTSPQLPSRYEFLDQFEGSAYLRRLIPVQIGPRLIIANIYEGRVKV